MKASISIPVIANGDIKDYEKPYTTAKVRLGVNEKIPVEIGKAVEACGADFVSVHGRTRAGKYKAPVDYDAIKQMKASISIPVIANGDIKDYEKAKEVFSHGSGSNLLGDLKKLEEILSTIKKYSKKQYTTAKVRLGVNEKIPVEIGKAVEACGADFVSVHGSLSMGLVFLRP